MVGHTVRFSGAAHLAAGVFREGLTWRLGPQTTFIEQEQKAQRHDRHQDGEDRQEDGVVPQGVRDREEVGGEHGSGGSREVSSVHTPHRQVEDLLLVAGGHGLTVHHSSVRHDPQVAGVSCRGLVHHVIIR